MQRTNTPAKKSTKSAGTRGKLVRVPLDKITRDPRLQSRVLGLNEQHIADLTENLDELPPGEGICDGVKTYLIDGFHRYESMLRAGKKWMMLRVTNGTLRDAILAAAGANPHHGLPRTNADKRRAVTMLLEDEEWRNRSARWIADQCHVSEHLVGDLRKSGAHSRTSIEGKDGKTYHKKGWKGVPDGPDAVEKFVEKFPQKDAERVAKFKLGDRVRVVSKDKADKAYFNKCATVTAVNDYVTGITCEVEEGEWKGKETLEFSEDVLELVATAPADAGEVELFDTTIPATTAAVKDATGRPIEDLDIVSDFNQAKELMDLARRASDIKSQLLRAVEDKISVFTFVPIQRAQVDCANLYRDLSHSVPHAVCRYCNGAGRKTKACKECKGTGWMTKDMFTRVPKEMQ